MKAAAQLTRETGLSNVSHSNRSKEPSWGAMQADGLVDIMRGYLSGTVPVNTETETNQSSASADNHLVMVHVDERALAGAESDSAKPDGVTSQYLIETVRRLCCDDSIAAVVENAEGEPLNVGRRVRTVTAAIRHALWARDGGCAFPGCDHKRIVDAHHIKHWADGGETSVENMVLLCSHHHKLVHEGRFSIQRDQSGGLFFRRPDGKALPHCGYLREDWIDSPVEGVNLNADCGDAENSREFFNGLSYNESGCNNSCVKESGANYYFH